MPGFSIEIKFLLHWNDGFEAFVVLFYLRSLGHDTDISKTLIVFKKAVLGRGSDLILEKGALKASARLFHVSTNEKNER